MASRASATDWLVWNLILRVGKHPLDDPTKCEVVVYH
jgi:hypothetical protein